MKWYVLCGGIAVVAAALLYAYGRRRARNTRDTVREADVIDGGVRHRTDEDAPRVIVSENITSFELETSHFSIADGEDGGHYSMKAELCGDFAETKFSRRERNGKALSCEYTRDADFMKKLYGIVKRYDFAQYNGKYYHVSGLPDMYGSEICVTFDSGESIRSRNNQTPFIPVEAVRELSDLFKSKTNEN